MVIALIGLILALIGAGIAAKGLMSIKTAKAIKKILILVASVATLALFIVSTIMFFSEGDYGYWNWDYAFEYAWSGFGLGIGALVSGVICLVLTKIKFAEKEEQEETDEPVEIIAKGNFVLLSASSNVGIGFLTSICVACASLVGVESKNYTKKMNKAAAMVKERLLKQMEKYPDFDFADFRIVRDGRLAYTGTVIGTKKQ